MERALNFFYIVKLFNCSLLGGGGKRPFASFLPWQKREMNVATNLLEPLSAAILYMVAKGLLRNDNRSAVSDARVVSYSAIFGKK